MEHGAVGRSVVVVGMGYVGLPSALALAESGSIVTGYDISEDRLSTIKAGLVDLVPSDHDRLRRHLGSDRFMLTMNPASLATADTVLLCVPTPIDRHLSPDLTALSEACRTVVDYAVKGQLIVLTSTSYVGCMRELLVEPLAARGLRVGEDVCVAFSPERIDPGNTRFSHETVPRVVGGVTPTCQARVSELLGRLTSTVHEVSSPEAAEITKLLENTFRAVNIALVNEFADVCGQFGLDIVEVIEAAATKPYGFMPFYPGAGVGGHCIPCDPHYLLWQLRARRMRLPVIETAMSSTVTRPRQVVARARQILADRGRSLATARVLIAGVTYKPGVSDLRESPALEIIRDLLAAGADVAFADPYVDQLHLGDYEVPGLSDPTTDGWDLVVLHTRHPDTDYGWLAAQSVVLDLTYRARHLPNRATL